MHLTRTTRHHASHAHYTAPRISRAPHHTRSQSWLFTHTHTRCGSGWLLLYLRRGAGWLLLSRCGPGWLLQDSRRVSVWLCAGDADDGWPHHCLPATASRVPERPVQWHAHAAPLRVRQPADVGPGLVKLDPDPDPRSKSKSSSWILIYGSWIHRHGSKILSLILGLTCINRSIRFL